MSTDLRVENAEPAGIRQGDTLKVYVLNMRGKPLMPCSPCKARKLLKMKKAKVVCRAPFQIQLTYATGETMQPVTLGIDSGSKTIGLSAATEKAELYASEVGHRRPSRYTQGISERTPESEDALPRSPKKLF